MTPGELRDARTAALSRHWVSLTDNRAAALPRFLDDLDAIDRQHAAETALTADAEQAQPAKPRGRART